LAADAGDARTCHSWRALVNTITEPISAGLACSIAREVDAREVDARAVAHQLGSPPSPERPSSCSPTTWSAGSPADPEPAAVTPAN